MQTGSHRPPLMVATRDIGLRGIGAGADACAGRLRDSTRAQRRQPDGSADAGRLVVGDRDFDWLLDWRDDWIIEFVGAAAVAEH